MPRKYQKAVGARKYKNYTNETLQECLAAIENKKLTQRKASERYDIPRRTIINQLQLMRAGIPSRSPGSPTTFSKEEEVMFVDCIIKLSEHGFPLTVSDLRFVISSYLDKIGRRVIKFKDGNYPGIEWVSSFLKRNPDMSQRFAANIKRNRAAGNRDTIHEYIKNLEPVVKDVPPENIWNYDETNLCDDPGKKKVITKRGIKYPEVIRNTSKSSTSIMFAGNAAGELLPPYTVYKAKQLWNTWTENGPKNARYNNSPSGWFDMNIFNDWFFSLILPRLKKQEGAKVLIGDNLSSHISIDVLKACDQNDIRFICLPPNSTHLAQPLDVAFFHPMKVAWRKILSEWKASAQGSREAVIQKSSFPILLTQLFDVLEKTREENLKSGFRKCGIYPLDVNPLLERLPKPVDKDALQDSFLETLEAKRLEWTNGVATKRRRTKLNIIPGQSITGEALLNNMGNATLSKPSTSKAGATTVINTEEGQATYSKPKKCIRKKKRVADSESDSDSDATMSLRDSECEIDFEGLVEDEYSCEEDISIIKGFLPFVESNTVENIPSSSNQSVSPPESRNQQPLHGLNLSAADEFSAGDFVVAKFIYNADKKKPVEKRFVGQLIDAVEDSHVFVKFMRKSVKAENTFIFPQVDDEQLVHPENVILKIVPLKVSRGRYLFPKFIKDYSCS